MAFQTRQPDTHILSPVSSVTASSPHTVTLLKAKKDCHKVIKGLREDGSWEVEDYPLVKFFEFWSFNCENIDDILTLLMVLSNNPRFFIILGRPTEKLLENYDDNTLETLPTAQRKIRPSKDSPATIVEHLSSLLTFDMDDVEIQGLTHDADGAAKALEILTSYIPQLKNVTCVYQWTSKAGMKKDHARIRFYFFLATPMLSSDMKKWVKDSGAPVDVAIYAPHQPIYTSNPKFDSPDIKDPIPQDTRIGMLEYDFRAASCPTKYMSGGKKVEKLHRTAYQDAMIRDPILQRLHEKGLVREDCEIEPGKYNLIECPWADNHSDQSKRADATYWQPYHHGKDKAGFHCLHSHCQDKDINALKYWLGMRQLGVPDASEEVASSEEAISLADPDKLEPVIYEDIDRNDPDYYVLRNRYIYVVDHDMFYDMCRHTFIKPEALGRKYKAYHSGDAGQIHTQLLSDTDAIRAENVVYLPGKKPLVLYRGDTHINTWSPHGSSIPIPGDVSIWIAHMEWLFPDQVEREYLYDWMAFIIQNPGVKVNHSVLIAGTQRNGKDSAFEPFKMALGEHNTTQISAEEMLEQFTNYLDKTKLLVIHEAENFEKRNLENKLKPILAAPPHILRIRMFGRGFYETPNVVQGLFFSNHYVALKISKGDGRYYALWCPQEPQSPEYYGAYWDWMEQDNGFGKVHYWLLNRDVSHFNPKTTAPETRYKKDIQDLGMTGTEMILAEMIESRVAPFDRDIVNVTDAIKTGLIPGMSTKQVALTLAELRCHRAKIRTATGYKWLWCVRNPENYFYKGLKKHKPAKIWQKELTRNVHASIKIPKSNSPANDAGESEETES